MLNSLGKPSSLPKKQQKQEREWLASSFRPENFIPGLVIGFLVGLLWDFSKLAINDTKKKKNFVPGKLQEGSWVSNNGGEELKMVLVVRQDLKMKSGKIASQCAHAATGMYSELMYSHRSLLRQWEQNGQPKIVVMCKNQQEMNKLNEAAENIGLPTFVVADAGRTQIYSVVCHPFSGGGTPAVNDVLSGSKTVLAIGPGPKEVVDSVTGKLCLL